MKLKCQVSETETNFFVPRVSGRQSRRMTVLTMEMSPLTRLGRE